MKKVFLSLLAIGLVAVSCQKYDQSDEISDLKKQIAGNSLAIVTNAQAAASGLANATNMLNTAITAVQTDLDAEKAAAMDAIMVAKDAIATLTGLVTSGVEQSAAILELIKKLQADIAILQAKLIDLGEEIDDVADDALTVTFTAYKPLFEAQIVNFDQTRTSSIEGIAQSDVQDRTILVSLTATSTISMTSTELKEDVDVNGDRDHADLLTRTAMKSIYTGTVSGTSESLGTISVIGAVGAWKVHDDN